MRRRWRRAGPATTSSGSSSGRTAGPGATPARTASRWGPGLIPSLEESIDNKTWVVGTPEDVAEGIAFYRGTIGVDGTSRSSHSSPATPTASWRISSIGSQRTSSRCSDEAPAGTRSRDAHPSTDSYSHRLVTIAVEALEGSHEVILLDLHRMAFDPVMGARARRVSARQPRVRATAALPDTARPTSRDARVRLPDLVDGPPGDPQGLARACADAGGRLPDGPSTESPPGAALRASHRRCHGPTGSRRWRMLLVGDGVDGSSIGRSASPCHIGSSGCGWGCGTRTTRLRPSVTPSPSGSNSDWSCREHPRRDRPSES